MKTKKPFCCIEINGCSFGITKFPHRKQSFFFLLDAGVMTPLAYISQKNDKEVREQFGEFLKKMLGSSVIEDDGK